jgi:hypothetical protein
MSEILAGCIMEEKIQINMNPVRIELKGKIKILIPKCYQVSNKIYICYPKY